MRLRLTVCVFLASTVPVTADTPTPAKHRIHPLPSTDVRWTGGFWHDRMELCRRVIVPTMGDLMEGTTRSQFLHNFKIAAGLADGSHRGPAWNDGDFYKWIECASAVFATTKDPALDRRLDSAIAIIRQAQRGDGYIHTPVLIAQRNGKADVKPFADRLNFEMYNFGHLMTAGCVHFQATGKRTLLEVAIRCADFLAKAFDSPTPESARHAVCPAHYMGCIDLFRVTGDKRFLNLAVKLFEMREIGLGGGDDNQDRLPFRRQTEAVGHAVRANYLYAGAADIYAETGDETLLATLTRIGEDVFSKKVSITGGCGALYDGASPDGSKEQKQITRIHQAYGRAYQLPNATAHNETCAAVGSILWNHRMLRVTGDSRYADRAENALFNSLAAGVSLDGKRYFYTNTLRQLDTMPASLRWSRHREEWISCYCCPPNVARSLARTHLDAYGRSDRGLWIHHFGSSEVDTRSAGPYRIKLRQSTDYPWSGDVSVAVEETPEQEWSLFIRIPEWASGSTLRINDREVTIKHGAYAELRRTWRKGDQVRLQMPLATKLMHAHPLAEEIRGQTAVMRGPLVYCAESFTSKGEPSVLSLALPGSARFEPIRSADMLKSITLLQTEMQVREEAKWTGSLYRELKPAETRRITARLIPYYAWGNRGTSEMSVWIPLGP